jgi:hydrogenase large subunit
MWVNGDYRNGVSTMDRHVARAQEAVKIVRELTAWVNELQPAGPVFQSFTTPTAGTGIGLTEAPRGALGHWLKVTNGSIANYQIISPTCWNASPRDSDGVRGPIEQALIGLPILDIKEPVEVARVIHSFDPCLGCAVHVMRPDDKGHVFTLNMRG